MADRSDGAEPYRILFVCTGNTCRSPMAEVIARRRIEDSGWKHVEVASAGVAAFTGTPASGGAVRAAARNDLDLTSHVSTLLTPALVDAADLVLTMSPSHLARVRELGGGARADLLTSFADGGETGRDPRGVPDPIGGPDEEYLATFDALDELVKRALVRIEPLVKP